MDDACFDRLAASFARGASRRWLLGTVLGGALAAPFGQPRNATAKKKKKKCPKGRPRCGNTCCKTEETCRKGKCRHHCEDGVLNFGETDVDCGGVCDGVLGFSPFGRCDLRKRCGDGGEDCRSGLCQEVQPGTGKVCIECITDNNCDTFAEGRPRCLDKFCFECAADGDCPAGRPFCVAPAGVCPNRQGVVCACRECKVDADCPARQICDDFSCVAGTCGAGQDVCDDGIIGCNGNNSCLCRQTTLNQPFCSDGFEAVTNCSDAAFCRDFGVGAGSECVRKRGLCGNDPVFTSVCTLPCA